MLRLSNYLNRHYFRPTLLVPLFAFLAFFVFLVFLVFFMENGPSLLRSIVWKSGGICENAVVGFAGGLAFGDTRITCLRVRLAGVTGKRLGE